MSGAADSEIVRRGRWQFNGWRSAAVLLAALSRVSVTKEAGAKPPRWQARKSTVSAIRPRPTRNARGESAGSSRARGNSARYAPTGAKTKAERREEGRVVGLALSKQRAVIERLTGNFYAPSKNQYRCRNTWALTAKNFFKLGENS
jgi:hypothetical protein